MSPERRRLIAQRGNKKLREMGMAYKFNSISGADAAERKQRKKMAEGVAMARRDDDGEQI